jgi:hypothetical protein
MFRGFFTGNPPYSIPPYSSRVRREMCIGWDGGFAADLIVGCRRVSQTCVTHRCTCRRFAGCVCRHRQSSSLPSLGSVLRRLHNRSDDREHFFPFDRHGDGLTFEHIPVSLGCRCVRDLHRIDGSARIYDQDYIVVVRVAAPFRTRPRRWQRDRHLEVSIVVVPPDNRIVHLHPDSPSSKSVPRLSGFSETIDRREGIDSDDRRRDTAEDRGGPPERRARPPY